ncbi:hypothetical protein R3F64_15745 [Halomonas sp. 5021]|jgi:hypothetical protein|uniref:hypothetical protein n=1 Tax=Halomonas sp. 5021 TaxID=3082156 RepID=UPI002FCBE2B2
MSRVQPHVDKLEDLLGTMSGLAGIMQKDLCRRGSEEGPALNDHDIGCLLSAIDELANRGYYALDAIDRASQGQEVHS